MVSIYASLGNKGINIVKHLSNGTLQRSIVPAPKLENSYKAYAEYAKDVFKSYPAEFQEVAEEIYGHFNRLGIALESVGKRTLPNGDVCTFVRWVDQNDEKCLNVQLHRAGKLISSKIKHFVEDIAQVQEKFSYSPKLTVDEKVFHEDMW